MHNVWLVVVGLGLGLTAGCGDKAEVEGKKERKATVTAGAGGHGWWCDEHGVKEEECSMCDAKVAEACRAKGDWCDKPEHNRAKSQCFICDPSLKDKFAAQYRAKYGEDKTPPVPTGQVEKK